MKSTSRRFIILTKFVEQVTFKPMRRTAPNYHATTSHTDDPWLGKPQNQWFPLPKTNASIAYTFFLKIGIINYRTRDGSCIKKLFKMICLERNSMISIDNKSIPRESWKCSQAAPAGDDCEWVDDAVLNLTAAFSNLCHTAGEDYVEQQVEYERLRSSHDIQVTRNSSICQHPQWSSSQNSLVSLAKKSIAQVRPQEEDHSSLSSSSRQLIRMASLMDNMFLDDLGFEVQLQSFHQWWENK